MVMYMGLRVHTNRTLIVWVSATYRLASWWPESEFRVFYLCFVYFTRACANVFDFTAFVGLCVRVCEWLCVWVNRRETFVSDWLNLTLSIYIITSILHRWFQCENVRVVMVKPCHSWHGIEIEFTFIIIC